MNRNDDHETVFNPGVVDPSDAMEGHAAFAWRVLLTPPEEIRRQSSGEVQTVRIFSKNQQRFHPSGLFSEEIFGPALDWKQSTSSARIGHTELPVPLFHPAFRSGIIGRVICAALEMSELDFDHLLWGSFCVIANPGNTGWLPGSLVMVKDYEAALKTYGPGSTALYQSEAVCWLLEQVDIDLAIARVKRAAPGNSSFVRIVRMWFENGPPRAALFLSVLPVLPPIHRPFTFSSRGKPRPHDLTCLYRTVIRRSHTLRRLMHFGAPTAILLEVTRRLYLAVGTLLVKSSLSNPSNSESRRFQPVLKMAEDSLKPLRNHQSAMIRGNSIRLPVAPNPAIAATDCGLPRNDATLGLLAPLWYSHCQRIGFDLEDAKLKLRSADADVWKTLEQGLSQQVVLLTMHARRSRASMQAFQPRLVEGNALQLAPIAVQAMRDSSQVDDVSVFLFSSRSARGNALVEMQPDQLRNQADGRLLYEPTLDVVLGCFHLTRDHTVDVTEQSFRTVADVQCALDHAAVSINSPIKFRLQSRSVVEKSRSQPTVSINQQINTTPGRVIFNDLFPIEMPFLNFAVTKADLRDHLQTASDLIGSVKSRRLLESLQGIAIEILTRTGSSVSQNDLASPSTKPEVVNHAFEQVGRQWCYYDKGFATHLEAHHSEIDVWNKAAERIHNELAIQIHAANLNPKSMLVSVANAYAGVKWLKPVCGMLAHITGYDGRYQGVAIPRNWSEGLSAVDYWQVIRASRYRALQEEGRCTDADALIRSLLEAMQVVVVTMDDCGTNGGIEFESSQHVNFSDVLCGRISCETITNPVSGENVVQKGQLITAEIIRQLELFNILKLRARSPAMCEAEQGVCQQCYGPDRSTGERVLIGASVGLAAAFSTGERADELIQSPHFHLGFPTVCSDLGNGVRVRRGGIIDLSQLRTVPAGNGTATVMRAGTLVVRDTKQRQLELFDVPRGALIEVPDGSTVASGQTVCSWHPDFTPLLAEHAGTVAFGDFLPGITCEEFDSTNEKRMRILASNYHGIRPHVQILDAYGTVSEAHYLAENMQLVVKNGCPVAPGDKLALRPTVMSSSNMSTNGSNLEDLLTAGPTDETAVLAPIAGVILSINRMENGYLINIQGKLGDEIELQSEHFPSMVRVGETVAVGDRLTNLSRIDPNDIFQILGIEEGVRYMLNNFKYLVDRHKIAIDLRHFELVIRRMLSQVRIESPGDTEFSANDQVEVADFQRENDRVRQLVRVWESKVPEVSVGTLLSREKFDALLSDLQLRGITLPKAREAQLAWGKSCLTSIRILASKQCRKDFFGRFDVHELAGLALTGERNPIIRQSDLAMWQLLD